MIVDILSFLNMDIDTKTKLLRIVWNDRKIEGLKPKMKFISKIKKNCVFYSKVGRLAASPAFPLTTVLERKRSMKEIFCLTSQL